MNTIKDPISLSLIDVNYENRTIQFKTNTGEKFKMSFECIQDISDYTRKENDMIWNPQWTFEN